ncbi:MAG: universal stress protein [Actinomycetota bacterium]|jgi:nucleotide-binding universal stress UspA family protein|nr:universal stress protein [Actinomycetota bacterium]
MASRRVVVGLDGSVDAGRALAWAAALVADAGGELVAVHVTGLLARAHAEAAMQPWCAPLQDAGVALRCMVVDGNPVLALVQAAAEVGADMVVVGKRGSGGFPGLQLGSTSQELVAHAPLPVVVVPGP